MMVHPPNTFLQFWTAKELRAWWKEIKYRKRYAWGIWGEHTVPTSKQTKAEFRRRKLPIIRKMRR